MHNLRVLRNSHSWRSSGISTTSDGRIRVANNHWYIASSVAFVYPYRRSYLRFMHHNQGMKKKTCAVHGSKFVYCTKLNTVNNESFVLQKLSSRAVSWQDRWPSPFATRQTDQSPHACTAQCVVTFLIIGYETMHEREPTWKKNIYIEVSKIIYNTKKRWYTLGRTFPPVW